MKTIKFIALSGLSLLAALLIFSSVLAQESRITRMKDPLETVDLPVIHKVFVHLPAGPIQGITYRIELTDQNGRPVAMPQTFIPGESTYIFLEDVAARCTRGTRIARFILVTSAYNNPNVLWAKPDMKTGIFISGRTYLFNLYLNNFTLKQ
jgi:hypothetical protein